MTTITIRSLFLSAYNLFVRNTLIRYSFQTTIRYATLKLFVSAKLYSLDLQTGNLYNTRLIQLLLHCRLLYHFLLQQRLQSNEHFCNGEFLLPSSRLLYCDHFYICIFIHVILLSLLLLVQVFDVTQCICVHIATFAYVALA